MLFYHKIENIGGTVKGAVHSFLCSSVVSHSITCFGLGIHLSAGTVLLCNRKYSIMIYQWEEYYIKI